MEKDIDKTNIVKKKSKKNYINGNDFYKSLVEYNEFLKNAGDGPKPQIPRYVGECIVKIATNLATKFNFASYSFVEEMKSDAICKMIECVEKYEINYSSLQKPNPLGYFTQISWNMFLERINKEKKQQYIKHKNFQKIFVDNGITINEDGEDFQLVFDNEEHNRVINEYENKKVREANYVPHRNLDYTKNSRKKKIVVENQEIITNKEEKNEE